MQLFITMISVCAFIGLLLLLHIIFVVPAINRFRMWKHSPSRKKEGHARHNKL